jgi:hypothetical protein
VDRIATTPMSRPQREQAVAALAMLITAWQHGAAAEPGQDPADTVPSSARASNTDHAATTRDHHPQNTRATP